MKSSQLAVGKHSANWTENHQKQGFLPSNENCCYLPTAECSANWTKCIQTIVNKINDLGKIRSWQKLRFSVGKSALPTGCIPYTTGSVAIVADGCAAPTPKGEVSPFPTGYLPPLLLVGCQESIFLTQRGE